MPKPRPSATARGYDHRHRAERKRWAPLVAAGRVECWRCGQRIEPGTPWDLGHDDHDRTVWRGPEHRHPTGPCPGNRAAGARKGNALARARRATTAYTRRAW